jgi:predicted TIM-barrel fold metal-dependent hydrolase
VKGLLAEMDRASVREAAAIVVPDQDAARVQAANTELLAQASRHKDRLVAVASLPSDDPAAALAELERVARAGVRAVKVTPKADPGDFDRLSDLVERASALDVVVLFDGWRLDLDALAKLALAHPKAKLVVAHLGGVHFSDVLLFDIVRRYPFYKRNVWFDLSTVAHLYARSPYAEQLVWVCRKIGTDRILFGSDFPLLPLDQAVDDVRSLGFTPEELKAILHDNAQALLGPAPAQAKAGPAPTQAKSVSAPTQAKAVPAPTQAKAGPTPTPAG